MTKEQLIQNLKATPANTPITVSHLISLLSILNQEVEQLDYSKWDSEKLIDENTLAVWLNKNVQTLRNWRNLGKGPKFIKDSRSVNYRVGTVIDWIKSKEIQSTSQFT